MHMLDFTKGRAAIAFAGETPWHGYGEKILPSDTIEEIRVKAGLDYDVIGRPAYYSVENDLGKRVPTKIPGKQVLLRQDNQDYLSIVGQDYKIVQPSKVLEFFRDLVDLQGLSINVAGALDDGRKVWALAKLDDTFELFGQDKIQPYVLVATSYDGKLATTAMLSTIRVVCMNTLRFSGAFTADENSSSVFKVRHDKEFSITEAHGKLGLREDAWLEHKRQLDNLARFQLSEAEALEYFYLAAGQGDDIVRNEDNGNVVSFPEPTRVTKQFINAYLNGPGANYVSAKGTLFGALQAVTHYQDHLAPAGTRGKRFDSATFGGGNVRKQHAFELALAKFADAEAA